MLKRKRIQVIDQNHSIPYDRPAMRLRRTLWRALCGLRGHGKVTIGGLVRRSRSCQDCGAILEVLGPVPEPKPDPITYEVVGWSYDPAPITQEEIDAMVPLGEALEHKLRIPEF